MRVRTAGTAVLAVCALVGCDDSKPSPGAPPPIAAPPIRGAAGDDDLRVMIAELASSKACALIRGQFRALRAPERPEVATGILWIHGCDIDNDGLQVRFRLRGHGWEWANQTKRKAGGEFSIHQYVKFGMEADIPGALDVAYDRRSHVVSLWFTPAGRPAVRFEVMGDVDVDREGVWSSIVGALGSLFVESPEDRAKEEAEKLGKAELGRHLADGLAVTVNLCTGLSRFNLGRQPKGKMQPADVGRPSGSRSSSTPAAS